ncbi:glycosyltransferase family 39 protein [Spirosoma koreense]
MWGTYQLLEKATEDRQKAWMGTLLIMVCPMYLNMSASFMTDVPFYALAVWSLSYLVVGLKNNTDRPILIGLLLAAVALLIRQFGIVLFVGTGIAYAVRKNFSIKGLVVAFFSALTGVGIQALYQKWLEHVLEGTGHVYNAQANNFAHLSFYKLHHIQDFIGNAFIALMYLGAFLFPYFLLLITNRSWTTFRANRWLWGILTVIILSIWQFMFDGMNMPIWWNTLTAFGMGPVLVRDIYFHLYGFPLPEFLHLLMIGLTVCSLLGSIGLLFYLVKSVQYVLRWPLSTPQRTIAILMLSMAGIYFFPLSLQGLFDRYLLLLIVLALVLIHIVQQEIGGLQTARPLRPFLYLSVSLYVIYAVFSVSATHDYMAWNRVRWQTLHAMMKAGVPPTAIDGGFEFNGWYLYDSHYKASPDKSWWWVHGDTYVLGASVLPEYNLFQEHKVETWLPWGMTKIVVGKRKQG